MGVRVLGPLARVHSCNMSSIHTNLSAMAALQTLRRVDATMSDQQRAVSSGLRVQKASDNAAYWSIASTMRSDRSILSSVSSSIGVAQGVLDVTYSGMEGIHSEMTTIRNLVVAAKALPVPDASAGMADYPSSEIAKLDQEIVQHFQQISSIAKSSSFSGINLLVHQANGKPASSESIDFVTGYNSADGIQTTSLSLANTTMIDYNYNGLRGFAGNTSGGILDGYYAVGESGSPPSSYGGEPVTISVGGSVSDSTDYNKGLLRLALWYSQQDSTDPQHGFDLLISDLDKRITDIANGMAHVGSVQSRLNMQADFTQRLGDTVEKGIGRLVDADMNEASTKLRALQTREQLSVQSLSIANSKPDSILQLFR